MTRPDPLDALLRAAARGAVSRRDFVRRGAALGLGLPALGALVAACGERKPAGAADESLGELEPELAIYNWSDYVAEDTITNFEKEFGVRVRYDTYESNEELLARMGTGTARYDLIMPTNYAVAVLASQGALAPLKRRYIPNFTNLAPTFLNPVFDPDNTYSVAYQWGTTGFAYRADKIPGTLDSWGIFLDGAHRGRMTQMDDMRDALGAWLRYRGKSLNSVDPSELALARSDALAARRNLRAYISAQVKGELVSGEVWVAQLWNGDTAQAQAEQPAIRYVLPREGCAIWTDSMVVPRGAAHPRAAHEFINYVLRPGVGAAISNATGYGSPNQAALAQMRRPLPFPTAEEFQRLEYERDLGDATALWQQIWAELKSS